MAPPAYLCLRENGEFQILYTLTSYSYLELNTVSKVSDSISIRKSVSVSERQINDTFNNTFHNDINKHRAILTQKSKVWQHFILKHKIFFCTL